MDFITAIITLLLVMDALGNIPAFLSVLKNVAPERRRLVLVREIMLALAVLVLFLLFGNVVLRLLGLDQEAISIAGGIVLFLIAIRMIFPGPPSGFAGDALEGEPFLVPLAIPLVAGPSTLATVLLLQQSATLSTLWVLLAVVIAWALTGATLLSATFLYRVLGERGLIALERLMGMLLVMMSVQMLMNGVKTFLAR